MTVLGFIHNANSQENSGFSIISFIGAYLIDLVDLADCYLGSHCFD